MNPPVLPEVRVRPAFYDRDDLACIGADGDLFFDTPGPFAEAKRLCASCPAEDACREHAIKHQAYGFWGGMSADARAAERLRRAGAAERVCEVCAAPYMPRTAEQRACGVKCARQLTKRGVR